MAQPGLTERLRRHSRSSGLMVGISMAAAIIICIAAFIWIYFQIQPLFSDFIPRPEPTEEQTAGVSLVGDEPTPTPTVAVDDFDAPTPAPTLPPTPTPVTEDDSADDAEEVDVWEATHQIRQGPNVNFRSGPNTISQTQGALPPGTPLRFLGDEQPAGGVIWMRFDIDDGTEGWIRNIDVEEFDGDG